MTLTRIKSIKKRRKIYNKKRKTRKLLKAKGILLMCDMPNSNGNIYTKEAVTKMIEDHNSKMDNDFTWSIINAEDVKVVMVNNDILVSKIQSDKNFSISSGVLVKDKI